MIRHKRTIEQKFKAIVAMIVAMGLVSGFTLQDGTISDAWSLPVPGVVEHTPHSCTVKGDNAPYDIWWEEDGQHQEKCSVCYSTTTLENHDFSDTSLYKYDDNVDAIHHVKVCKICGYEETDVHHYPSPIFVANNKHQFTCIDCGKNDYADCSLFYALKGSGEHIRKCRFCDRADDVVCSDPSNEKLDADGFCEICEPNAIAAKNALDDFYNTAKASPYNWNDSFDDTRKMAWLNALSDTAFAALEAKFDDYNTKSTAITDDEYDYGNITNYLGDPSNDNKAALYGFFANAIANNWRSTPPDGFSPLADPESVTIQILDRYTNAPVDDAVLNIKGSTVTGSGADCDLKNGYTITLVSGTSSDLSGTTLKLANDTYTITNKTTANGYKPFETDTYKFTTDYSTSPFFSGLTDTPKDWVLKSPSAGVLNIYIEPLPKVEVELFKSDDLTHPLTTGAAIELSDGAATPKKEPYNAGDTLVVGTPASGVLSKSGTIITISPDTEITVLEKTTPAGYEWVTGIYKFKASAAGAPSVTSGSGTNFSESEGKLKVVFNKVAPTEITIKQYKKGTTDSITTGSLKITDSDSVTWKPGDKIVVGDPADSKNISKSGDTITVKAGETYTVESDVAPLGYKKFTPHNFGVASDGKSITVTVDTGIFEADATKGMKVFYEAGTDINLKASGNGKPDSYKYIIKDALGNEVTVDKDTGKYPLGEGTYTLSATAAKAGYKVPSGTFKVKADGTLDTTVSGDVSVDTGTTTVTLKYSDDKDIDDVDFVKYPKKEKKDEPDTDKDKLTGWAYKLERYTGSKSDPTDDDDDDNWKDVVTVKPSSTTGTKYTLDGEKIYTNTVYRLKETTAPSGYEKDSKYVYIKFDENGDPSLVSGKAAVDDNEVQLYDVPEDEDSDDVIAIHKTNNTGGELAGAHLQIYLYSESNTLAYGSSSTTAASTTSSSTTSGTTSSSTTSSTTKAKTTPAKPSVASSDVKFDWTSADKAKVIDIDDLEKGKNYTLREVSAPTGYETPAYDFVFKIGQDGTISIVRNYNGLLSVTGNKLVLKNLTPTEAAATRPKTGDHSKLALWLDICIVMLGGLYLSGYSIFEAFTEKKKVKVVAKKKPNNRRKR